jgi:WD40 repeat protein
LWDVTTRRPLGKPLRGHKNRVTSVAYSPDGKTLASGSEDGNVILWDLSAGEANAEPQGRPLAAEAGAVATVAFSPDGQILASGHTRGEVILWDAKSRRQLGEPITGGGQQVSSLAFNADGTVLAVADWDARVYLWDLQPALESAMEKVSLLVPPLTGHTSRATSVAVSPDGKMVAGGGCALYQDPGYCAQGGIILWDLETGRPLGQQLAGVSQPLTGYGNRVASLAFSPDGRRLAAGHVDGVVQTWLVGVEAWSEAACSSVKRNMSQEEWQYYLGGDIPYRETCPGQ